MSENTHTGSFITSDKTDAIYPAFIQAQFAVAQINKNRTVEKEYWNKKTQSYTKSSYKYATLDIIVEALKQPLKDNELAFMQTPSGDPDQIHVTTRIVHSSGQWIESAPITIKPSSEKIHDLGSALTYAKRYQLVAVFGLGSADEDDDGNSEQNAAEGNAALAKQQQRQQQQPAAAQPVGVPVQQQFAQPQTQTQQPKEKPKSGSDLPIPQNLAQAQLVVLGITAKHRGKPISSLDNGMLEWLLAPGRRHIAEAYKVAAKMELDHRRGLPMDSEPDPLAYDDRDAPPPEYA